MTYRVCYHCGHRSWVDSPRGGCTHEFLTWEEEIARAAASPYIDLVRRVRHIGPVAVLVDREQLLLRPAVRCGGAVAWSPEYLAGGRGGWLRSPAGTGEVAAALLGVVDLSGQPLEVLAGEVEGLLRSAGYEYGR